MKKAFSFLLFLTFVSFSFSQTNYKNFTSHSIVNLGYSNLNGNYLELGPELYLVQPNNNLIDISLTANLSHMNNEFIVVPELGLGYQFNTQKIKSRIDPYREYIKSSFYVARANISPWNVTPEIGISLLGLIEFNAGYSLQFREHKNTTFNGLKFGLTIHIPTIAIFGERGLHKN